MTSVVIAAHNEAAVIGRCLDAVLGDARPGELEVIVSANGCTDATAEIARARPGVLVVESPAPGKVGALNRGEVLASSYPRVYLDADIPASTRTIRALCEALERPGTLVATPERSLDVAGRPLVVRAYYAVQAHLPAFRDGLFGRGLIAVSEQGRARFEQFPDVVADDLFLDSLFGAEERARVRHVSTVVATPLHTRDLVRRLVRVRRGNAALRAASSEGTVVRPADRTAWLRQVLTRRPWLAPAALVYVVVTAYAALLARRGSLTDSTWGRDESTRVAAQVAP